MDKGEGGRGNKKSRWRGGGWNGGVQPKGEGLIGRRRRIEDGQHGKQRMGNG